MGVNLPAEVAVDFSDFEFVGHDVFDECAAAVLPSWQETHLVGSKEDEPKVVKECQSVADDAVEPREAGTPHAAGIDGFVASITKHLFGDAEASAVFVTGKTAHRSAQVYSFSHRSVILKESGI